ncbi:sulfatase-like hydrolase/transferase [Haloferula sp.]|uniref:sulfatase-like hydrolase/transferase n=1 Tax=Haloferula sp. TaxID=2497595 RepID=UPI00329D8980
MTLEKLIPRVFRSVRLFFGIACLAGSASGQETPDRIILFIIDGLSPQAPERIEMPHYNALKEKGAYYKSMHLPLPGHPEKGPDYPWGCSLPNPMLMSGTPFVGMDGIRENMIQHSFDPKETAFIVNARSYLDVSGGFGTYVSKPKNPDSLVIDITTETMRERDFAFMRVHLQRAGIEGMKVSWEKNSDKPYYRDIWHKESPYRENIEIADEQLGRFVDWLKAEDLWSGTVLMICGDHGQADEGWHEPYSPAANVTPLLIVGAGVSGPSVHDYCELFDIAPTITHLAKKKKPALSRGRILHEAFDPDLKAPKVAESVQRLNEVLIKAHALPDSKKELLSNKGFLTLDDLGKWHTTKAGTDFDQFAFQQEAILKSIQN